MKGLEIIGFFYSIKSRDNSLTEPASYCVILFLKKFDNRKISTPNQFRSLNYLHRYLRKYLTVKITQIVSNFYV